MLSRLLRELLFYLVHLVVSLLVAVGNVHRRFWTDERYPPEKNVTQKDIKLILENMPRDQQRLKHLVVLADVERHSLSDLAKVVIWSLVAGIPFVSFYDITGLLREHEEKFFIEVEKKKKGVPGCIKWSHRPDLNGYSNGSQSYTVVVNVFGKAHGQDTIAQCIRDIANDKIPCEKSSSEYTAQEFNKALKLVYLTIPDPDLILYTGPLCSTHGLLPWHIRLSEFMQLSPSYSLSVNNYIQALNKYYKCDQRFGK